MARWWMEGGVWMWAVLAADLGVALLLAVLFVVAIASAVTRKFGGVARIAAILGLLATLTPLCAGAIGREFGRSNVDQAVTYAAPEQQEIIRTVGYAEASVPFQFGLGSVCALFGGALVVAIAGFVAASRSEAAAYEDP